MGELGRSTIGGSSVISDQALVKDRAIVSGSTRITHEAQVYGDATIKGENLVCNTAKVYDLTELRGKAIIGGNARIAGRSLIEGDARITEDATFRNATISSNKDYLVFRKTWCIGNSIIWTRANSSWSDGSFFGSGANLILRGYSNSEECGKYYESFVKIVNEAYEFPERLRKKRVNISL